MKYQVLSIKKSRIWFLLFFVVLGFIALQIPFTQVVGSKVKFTLFDFFAPVSGAFLSTPIGVIAVFLMGILNILIHGLDSIDKGSIIRLFPVLFGVWYFAVSKKSKSSSKIILVVPAFSIIAFNLHPVGRTVWFYSLYWLIPIIAWPFRNRFLLAKSLGTTFTVHAVGGAIWIWAFNLPANVWISLIPIVALERGIFALGISASYLIFNNIFALLAKKSLLTEAFSFDKNYVLKFLKQ